MKDQLDYSVVVPLFDEVENALPLVEGLRDVMSGLGTWEIILVDDGSTDGTATIIDKLANQDRRVRALHLARNYGQTQALQAGFDHVCGETLVTIDGDLQNDPTDIPRLVTKLNEGYDLVTGYRVQRVDSLLLRKIPSKLANGLIRWITGVSVRDSGCALKVLRADLLDRLDLYSDMHRFIPVVAAATAGARIAEVPVAHRPRLHGHSKYGLSRVWKVAIDLAVIVMIRSFRERPMILFVEWAGLAALIGTVFAVTGLFPLSAGAEASTPTYLILPTMALLWFGLAFYLAMLGLMAEVALHGSWGGGLGRDAEALEKP